MDKKPTQTEDDLRQRAQRLLDDSPDGYLVKNSPSEIKQLLHELLVNQVELETQNEGLRSAAHRLDALQSRYFDHYDLAPMGYLTFDDQRLIMGSNLFAARMFGMSRNTLIDAPISQLLLKEDQVIFYENLKICIELDIPQHFEMRLIRTDGVAFWGLLQLIAMPDGEYWLTVTDIDRNKQVKAELRESDNKFRSVFEQAAMGVARVSLDGAWLEVNKKLCAIVGYSQQQLLTKSIQDLTHPEDLEIDQAALSQLINNEIRTYTKEKRYYNFGGVIVWVKLTMSLVRDINNEPDYFISIIEDITSQINKEAKQRTLTAQLQQAKKMEAVGHLAGGIAHDFNNMLGVILGQAELVIKKLGSNNSLVSHLEGILNAANHSANLTRQLLTFARKQTIEPKVLDLNGSVSAMIDMLKRLIGESIVLSWEPAENIWPVKVDPTQIDQVIVNLCINSRDAISGSGKISISASNCTLDKNYTAAQIYKIEPGDYVKLSVSDDGCGMDEATLMHIFEPFYTTKAMGSGTGLGLSSTFGAIKMNAGFVNVFSQPGQGTTFNIYFQRVKALEDTKQKIIKEQASQSTGTILLVEDEEMLLEIETSMLENSGYTVLAVPSGELAEAMLRKHLSEIDLLVTDVIMPEINGMELAVKLQAICPKLKVLFMSGYPADVLDRQANIKEGAHFLQKPFSMQALTSKVREVFNANLDNQLL
jgi:two-component system cell cycle sensor histidine kinase/response regulator CckA